jgi:tetratricopeptide (TPR) repeat protein
MRLATDQHATNVRRDWLIAGALAVLTYVVFAPALDCDFVNLDDPDYVTRNVHVKAGLNAAETRWALTSFEYGNWFPLTWLSLELDATLWQKPESAEPDPRGFHLTNVLVHSASAALLFLTLRALTGALWPSIAAAALFAVHPLRVESVAWVAERKDVLSTFFGILALRAYASYVRQPSSRHYLAVAVALLLSLLCKPMMVTLPCLLLVLDWWPLQRAQTLRDCGRLLVEKWLLFALVATASVTAFLAQTRGGAVMPLETFPLTARLENAAISYVEYLKNTVWPVDLAVFYPHRYYSWGAGLSLPVVAGAILFLIVVTAAAIRLRQRAPYLLAGWLWYVGTLVPVIGVVQAGDQSHADRYSYFSQVGILVAVCWGVADLARAWPRLAVAATALAVLILSVVTRQQLTVWQDSETLWRHDLSAAGDNPLGLTDLGVALDDLGKNDEADRYFRKSLELSPRAFLPHINRGNLMLHQNKLAEAEAEFRTACELQPYIPLPRTQLSEVLLREGRVEEAASVNQKALDMAPELSGARCNMGLIESVRHNYREAAYQFREAIRLQPKFTEAHCGLGNLLFNEGKVKEGLDELREALRCNPRYGEGHFCLGKALLKLRDPDAIWHFEKAAECSPNLPMIWSALGNIRARQGRWGEAVSCFERAVELDPNSAENRNSLADARKKLTAE